jgi:mRNA interferase MazF
MKRGDIVTIADRAGEFSGKPRPAIVIQSDAFPGSAGVVVVPLTTDSANAPMIHVALDPRPGTALRIRSYVMVEKIGVVRRSRVGAVIGRIEPRELAMVEAALSALLGLD